MWVCRSIINKVPMGWVLSFSLKYFYKNKNKENCIKLKILYKLNKIKWSNLLTLTIDNENL